MLNRRSLLIGMPLGTLVAPPIRAQQKPIIIGVLSSHNSQEDAAAKIAFLQAMRELGYVEDKHFKIAPRFADGRSDRLSVLAAELVGLNPDVILASGTPAAVAASQDTTTIPIAFDSVGDPIRIGLADSLSHPGRNSTGLSNFSGDLGGKKLQFLLQMVPSVTRVALLLNPMNPNLAKGKPKLLAAAKKLGLTILEFSASTPEEVGPAFTSMAQQHVQGRVHRG